MRNTSKYYALGVNHYRVEYAEVTVNSFYPEKQLLSYKTYTPWFYYSDADKLIEGDVKMGKVRRYGWRQNDNDEPLGLVTCDFYSDNELFTVKIIKNPGDAFYVRLLDSQKNIISEIRQAY